MKNSLGKKLKALFKGKNTDTEEFFEDLTDLLVEGDIGAKTSYEIVDELENACKSGKIKDKEEIMESLKALLLNDVKSIDLKPEEDKVNVWMVLGVNGVGKTTSVAKLGKYLKEKGNDNIVLASADTFRAAAIEQLNMHGERIGGDEVVLSVLYSVNLIKSYLYN